MNALLLSDPSPSLRLRALVELEGVPVDDPETAGLRAQIASSVEVQRALASRRDDTPGIAYTLCRLAFLGYDGPEMAEMAERLFERQQPDGSWPLWPESDTDKRPKRGRTPRVKPRSESYSMIPLQTSLPLRGLAAAGHATDPRAERAYEWLLSQRLDDGAWPGDTKADLGVGGMSGRTPGYRALPRSSGCRAATTGVVACLARHPQLRTSGETRAALDHLLARETREEWALGWEVSRLLGFERASGRLTFYARFDLAFLLDIASRCGLSGDDTRVAELVAFLEDLRGPYGLWEHPAHPQLSRWLTLGLEVSLLRLESGDWSDDTERVRFQPYPKRRRRY